MPYQEPPPPPRRQVAAEQKQAEKPKNDVSYYQLLPEYSIANWKPPKAVKAAIEKFAAEL